MINFKRKQTAEQFAQASNDSIYESNFTKGIVGAGLTVAAGSAHAVLDVSATVTEIGTAGAAVLLIGVAVITVKVGIKLYKWVQAAL